jgi:hypothetical protein
MKVAITCDYLISRNHYSEIIETILELYPEARIYTLAHKMGAILGRIEQRRITSSDLSHRVNTEEEFYTHSAKLPFLSKNIFVSCEYDLIINISRGLSHGFKKCEKSKQLTYLYDIGFEGKVKKSFVQKISYPWLINYFTSSFKQADYVWVSRPDLKKDLAKYVGDCEVVAPPFKISDYTLFPKDMFKHHFYLIESNGLKLSEARLIIKLMNELQREFQFIGTDDHLKELKDEYSNKPNLFFGNRCSGEHAPILAASKMFISFNEIDFPKFAMATLAVGRPVLILDSQKVWIDGNGIFSMNQFNVDQLRSTLMEFEKIEDSFEGAKLRGLIHDYHEIKFKSHLKRFIEKNFK